MNTAERKPNHLLVMDRFAIDLNYSSTSRQSLPSPPRPHSHSSGGSPITCTKGVVGHYDVTELNEQLRYFGISEETKKAITSKRKPKLAFTAENTQPLSISRDTLYTNKNASLTSPEHSSKRLSWQLANARSCYVDFTGSFNDAVRAHSLPLAARHCAPARHSASAIRQRSRRRTLRTPEVTQDQHSSSKRQQACQEERIQIKNGLLIIANGQAVDLKKDIKRSQKLEEGERRRLRREMRKYLDLVRSFDELFEQLTATKHQIKELKTA